MVGALLEKNGEGFLSCLLLLSSIFRTCEFFDGTAFYLMLFVGGEGKKHLQEDTFAREIEESRIPRRGVCPPRPPMILVNELEGQFFPFSSSLSTTQ